MSLRTTLVDTYWSSQGSPSRMAGEAIKASGLPVTFESRNTLEKAIDAWLRLPQINFGAMTQDVERIVGQILTQSDS